MRFSVIVPSYKRPSDLRRCVRGILTGDRLPDELVVVVRDTDTESQAVVDELANEEHGSLVRQVHVTPPGQVAAMNAGLEAATGDVIVLIDDDTEPTAVWLDRLSAAYGEPGVVGVGGRDRICDSPDTEPAEQVGVLTWYGKIIGNHHRGCDGIRRVQHLKGANMSFKRSALPPFDPNLFRAASMLNDTDASLGAGRHGVLLYDPEAIVEHYPAERGAGVTRDLDDPVVVRADSHNWTYCVLKHLRWWAKPVFVLYALSIGQGACIGLVKWIVSVARGRPKPVSQLWASALGKLEGLRTYLTRRSGGAVVSDPEAPDVS